MFGWDDSIAGGSFLVRNSWGRRWGVQGNSYDPYGPFEDALHDAWSIADLKGDAVLILGRSPNLVLGAVTALLNALQLVGILQLNPEQIGGLNVLAGAVVALVANTASIQIDAGNAAKARAAR